MDLSKVSTENLKRLRIHPDFRDDPLFKAVMKILKDDVDVRSEIWQVPTLCIIGVHSFGGALGGLIPQVIYFLLAVIYSYNDWSFGSFGSKFLLLVFFLVSAGVNWFLANEYDEDGYDKRANSIIVVITYICLRFFYTKIFYTVLISVAIQSVISGVFYYFNTIHKLKKAKEETYVAVSKTKQKISESEEYFNKARLMLEERVALCNAELQRRGASPVYPLGHIWWEKNIYWPIPVSYYSDLFGDEHCARYKSSASYEKYDMVTGEVIGRTDHDYTLQIHKEFFMFEVPKYKNADIFAHMKEKKFESLFSNVPAFDINTCDIYALGCRWIKYDSDRTETTIHVSPTQSQIDNARRSINQSRDADERLHNAFYKGVALTTDEMFYATGGKGVSWQEQMISDNQRRNDLDKFIKNNTYDDVSYGGSTHKNENSAVFMYIINGVVFYTKEPPFCNISDRYTLDSESKWFHSREEEIEAAILHLVLKEPRISRVIVGNIWNSFGETSDKEQIYARILHRFVDTESFDKYYKK